MKKFISLFIVILLILSMAIPVSAANPTETMEQFTIEETIALILGSTVSYRVEYAGFDTPFTGTFKPELLTETDQTYKDYRVFFKFPIPYLGQYDMKSIQLIFNLPFEVKNLLSLDFAVAPLYLCEKSGDFYLPYSFVYQIDNMNAPEGYQVVNSYSVKYQDSHFRGSINLSDVTYRFYGTSEYFGAYGELSTSGGINFALFGSEKYNQRIRIDGNFNDITTFGFTYFPVSGVSANSIGFEGLAFAFAPMSITYGQGGGYNPPDVVLPDDPIEPDPPVDPDNPTDGKGEYAEKLDEIYNALVASGQIQIQQNQTIINNQEVIKDKIDGITTPDEQTQQGVDDFSTQVDENDKKLDDIAEGMKIEVPDIETELDLSPIDEALTDDNFKSIFSVMWDDSRIVFIFILSFTVSIFGVIFRGKKT